MSRVCPTKVACFQRPHDTGHLGALCHPITTSDVHLHTSLCKVTHTCIHVHTESKHVDDRCVCVRAYSIMYMYTHICIYICIHFTDVCAYVCVHTYNYKYIYIYMYIYICMCHSRIHFAMSPLLPASMASRRLRSSPRLAKTIMRSTKWVSAWQKVDLLWGPKETLKKGERELGHYATL